MDKETILCAGAFVLSAVSVVLIGRWLFQWITGGDKEDEDDFPPL